MVYVITFILVFCLMMYFRMFVLGLIVTVVFLALVLIDPGLGVLSLVLFTIWGVHRRYQKSQDAARNAERAREIEAIASKQADVEDRLERLKAAKNFIEREVALHFHDYSTPEGKAAHKLEMFEIEYGELSAEERNAFTAHYIARYRAYEAQGSLGPDRQAV